MNNGNNFNKKSEFNSLIDEILKVDEIAQNKLLHEKELENKILEKIKLKKQEISAQLNFEAEQQLKKLEFFEENYFNNELAKLKQKKEQLVSNLKQIYEKNEAEWVELTISKTLNQKHQPIN